MHTTTTNRIARLVLGSVISLSSAVQAQSPNAPTHFDITLTAGDAVIKPDPLLPGAVTVKEAGAQNGAPTDTRVGLPNLSVRELDYLLPYTASFEGLDLELVSETVELIGTFDVAPNPAPEARFLLEGPQTYTYVADGVQLDDDGRDVAAYSGQLAYPATPVEVASVGEQRAARVVKLAFHPFRWEPKTGRLFRVAQVQLRVSWQERVVRRLQCRKELGDPQLPATLLSLAEAGVQVLGGVDTSYDHVRRLVQTDYLIITTDNVLANSQSLAAFVAMKQAAGFRVGTRSVSWIRSQFPAASTQASVRNYLRRNYQRIGLRYVLIISGHRTIDVGDPTSTIEDPIPMLLTWPKGPHHLVAGHSFDDFRGHAIRRCPTDLYYADLSMSSDWDRDGDGFAGERRDDVHVFHYSKPKKRYVTDFMQELVVARIPFTDVASVDVCLDASIAYQTTSPHDLDGLVGHMRAQVWLGMAETNFWGAHITGKNDLGDGIAAALPSGCDPLKMYQVGAYDEHLTFDYFPNRWRQQFGPGMAIWGGHGNSMESVMHVNPRDATLSWGNPANEGNLIHAVDCAGFQTNLTRAFALSSSCFNADPFPGFHGNSTVGDTLLEQLMLHATVAAVLNTGATLSNPVRAEDWGDRRWNGDVLYDAVRVLGTGATLGGAVEYVRRRGDYSGSGGVFGGAKAQNLLAANAFGDPAIRYAIGWGSMGH